MKTKIGNYKVSYTDKYITYFKLTQDFDFVSEKSYLTEWLSKEIEEYLEGKRTKFTLPYKLKGTEFQLKVWKALLEIPYGKTCSYYDIAEKIGNIKACRAVGNANNKNPITIIVPCHRVIGKTGKLVGYASGLDVKRKLLCIEK